MTSARANFLIAYPYLTKSLIEYIRPHMSKIRLLVDSGAFTAYQLGKRIELDDYCRFLESLPFRPWKYFTLDAIGDPEKTIRNYETMLSRGFNPIPVFTINEDFSRLDYFYKTSEIVGVGGMVGKGTAVLGSFIGKVMRHAKGRKVHLLGVTTLDLLKKYRPYMCDASSWEIAPRAYGRIRLYMGHGRALSIARTDCRKPLKPEILNAIHRLRYDSRNLRIQKNWGLRNTQLAANSAWMLQSDIAKRLGTNVFFAVNDKRSAETILQGMETLRDLLYFPDDEFLNN